MRLERVLPPRWRGMHHWPGVLLALVGLMAGLYVDAASGLTAQLLVGIAVWAVFFRLLHSLPRAWRPSLYACLIWATAGEILLSLVWGLYTYRLENIPFFIPPGHVLLFYLGIIWAPCVPRWLVAAVPLLAAGYAVAAWSVGFDTLSILLVGLFLLCMLRRDGRRLYATMFVLALALELYGTWLGNWTWDPEVPYLGLSSFNPPLAAGAFYCALDVLVAVSVRCFAQRSAAPGWRLNWKRLDVHAVKT